MDEKLFLQKLSEVAEWHRPQTGPNGAASVNKRARHPGPITQAELDEMTDQEAQDYYDQLMAYKESQPNDNIAPEITRVKIQAIDCEDCGKHCENGRQVQRKLCVSGQLHWRTSCQTCGLYRDPATGKFTLTSKEVHNYLNCYYRPKLGVYKSKYQPETKKKIEPDPEVKQRLKEMVKNDDSEQQFEMVAYDKGDSILYVREPISKE
jgi:hypothetical protein